MEHRTLGDSGLTVSAIGLGCAALSGLYGDFDAAEAGRVFDAALAHGIDFLDTSEIYGAQGLAQGVGHNERLIGAAIRGRRDGLVIATKCGHAYDEASGAFATDGRPELVGPACEASLRRLGVEAIDLLYLHRVDTRVPIEDTVGAMARLVEAGKVRHLGLSEAGPQTLRRADATHRIAALQSEYSVWTRDMEAEILPLCRELGIGFVAYAPLGRGMLTGALNSAADIGSADWRRDIPRFQGENFTRNRALVARLEALAGERGCTASQLALAWILAQPWGIVPIPGSDRVRYVAENAAAVEIRLAPEELTAIAAAAPPEAVAGHRKAPGQRAGIENA
jgi:aryl-alcohol dehydrogenase-like predicted oxidoreductase